MHGKRSAVIGKEDLPGAVSQTVCPFGLESGGLRTPGY